MSANDAGVAATVSPRIDTQALSAGVSAGSALEGAIAEFAAAAVRADSVDPIITELVRLRCAQYHDCRLCGSLRDQAALDNGFDESLQRQIGHYESSSLSPAQKTALRLCDAMIINPLQIDDQLSSELRQHFSPQQLVELCVDVAKWSQQKALVALRIEPPISDQHLTQLVFAKDGHPAIGAALSDD